MTTVKRPVFILSAPYTYIMPASVARTTALSTEIRKAFKSPPKDVPKILQKLQKVESEAVVYRESVKTFLTI